MMIKLGSGMLTWDGQERRTSRYGTINLTKTPFAGEAQVPWELDEETVGLLSGVQGVLVARVIETRESSHVGHHSRGLYPSTPGAGDEIELGYGRIMLVPCTGDWGSPGIALLPLDRRHFDLMDPRALYRVHEQTVDLYFNPGATMKPYRNEELEAAAESTGSGMFTMETQFTSGEDNEGVYYQADILVKSLP